MPEPKNSHADRSGADAGGTRERILDATARVLSERGYAGTKLSAIAEYAKIQAPAIYHYFGNREALIEETMWTGLAGLNVVMTEALGDLGPELNALERLLAGVEIHLTYMFSTSAYAIAYIRNTAQLPPAIRERQAQEETRLALIWRDLFVAAQKENLLRSDVDLTLMRLHVLHSLNITAEWWSPKLGTLSELIAATQAMVRASITVA